MADAATQTEKKDALLSQGAHEVRNAISVILGYGRMLSSERLGPVTDSQRKAAVEIVNSAAKLKVLADEMSQLSRLLAGGTSFVRTRVDIAPLIEAEIPSVPAALDGNIAIRVIDDAPSAAVSGDAALLRQALNAVMFAQRRELLTTTELCVAIDRVAGDQPTIRVTISGADRLAEVRRLPPSELEPMVEVRGGVGFKLSIARQVIERHGGRSLSKTEAGVSRDAQPTLIGSVVILPEL
jgi:signal transduction histidine kinase